MRHAILAALLMLGGCNPADSSPEKLVGAAFKAIAAKDLDAYRKHLLTTADLEIQASGQQGLFKQKMGYAGSVLKPEEQARQKADFEAASQGRLGMDFSKAQFVGVAQDVAAPVELMLGPAVDARLITVRARVDGREVVVADPAFLVIPWHNKRWRLLGMVHPSPP